MKDSQEEPTTEKSWLPSLQLVTNLAVVAGIIVLIFELNQNRDLAQVQAYDNAYLTATSRNLALLGETPQISIARSIFHPDDLTPEDVIVLHQYYTAILVNWRRLKDEHAIGYFGGGWEGVVAAETFHLNTYLGRKWWNSPRQFRDQEISAVVDRILKETSVEDSVAFYRNLLPKPELSQGPLNDPTSIN